MTLKGQAILIIDDNPSNLGVISAYLEKYDFEVLVARSGESGLEKAQFARPDLILLDIALPGIDGFEVCRRLKADATTQKIPVIFMTVFNDADHKVRGFDVGGVDYIIKPFQEQEVLARVTIHLRLRELTDQLEQKVCERTRELSGANQQLADEILERKRIERALREREERIERLNLELEQRVTQRTAELEAVNQELKNFAYIVSHDLKTPLRGISQLANWLVEDYEKVLGDDGKKMLKLLIDRVKWMDQLIEGVLQYSRIGRMIGKLEPIPLQTLVPELIEMLTPPAHISIRIEHELPVIVGDRTRIEQVFQNLLDNAIKFLDKPEGNITVRCVNDGAYWMFSVADNGPGIDQKYHEKIFQIFQTLATREENKSSGIGLAVVKKIVEFYGGRIGVTSTPGQGSEFWFTLPKTSAGQA